MTTYISILRGINVGGNRRIAMADLKKMFESLGFSNITTYIQSGNVIFRTNQPVDISQLEHRLEECIYANFLFEVPVIVRTIEELKQIYNVNPFLNDASISIDRLHVTFLNKLPSTENLEKIKSFDFLPDRFAIVGKEAFISCSAGYSDTKLSNQFFESKLKVSATTRNWKTVLMLIELANQINNNQ